MSTNDKVLKCDKSRDSNFSQLRNISYIFVTNDVSKLDKSSDFNCLQL